MFPRHRAKCFAPRFEVLEGRNLLSAAPPPAVAASVGTVDPMIAADHDRGNGARVTDFADVGKGDGKGIFITRYLDAVVSGVEPDAGKGDGKGIFIIRYLDAVVSGVESDAGKGDGKGIFVIRYLVEADAGKGDGKGIFITRDIVAVTGVPASRHVTLATGDLNGDGLPDLAVAGPDGKGDIVVEPLLDDGQGGLAPIMSGSGGPETLTMPHLSGRPKSELLMLSDLNGDHRADVLYVAGNRLGYALSNAQGGYDDAGVLSNPLYDDEEISGTNPFYEEITVGVADLDGDGPELIALSGNRFLTTSIGVSSVTSADGQTTSTLDFGAINTIAIDDPTPVRGRRATAAFVADVNGDGRPDLAAVFGRKIFVGVNTLKPVDGAAEHRFNWHEHTLPRALAHSTALYVGDLNGDGHVDVLAVKKKPKSKPHGTPLPFPLVDWTQ